MHLLYAIGEFCLELGVDLGLMLLLQKPHIVLLPDQLLLDHLDILL